MIFSVFPFAFVYKITTIVVLSLSVKFFVLPFSTEIAVSPLALVRDFAGIPVVLLSLSVMFTVFPLTFVPNITVEPVGFSPSMVFAVFPLTFVPKVAFLVVLLSLSVAFTVFPLALVYKFTVRIKLAMIMFGYVHCFMFYYSFIEGVTRTTNRKKINHALHFLSSIAICESTR
jgi:hypothetical protein